MPTYIENKTFNKVLVLVRSWSCGGLGPGYLEKVRPACWRVDGREEPRAERWRPRRVEPRHGPGSMSLLVLPTLLDPLPPLAYPMPCTHNVGKLI